MKQNPTKQNKNNNSSKAMYFILCQSATPVHGICRDIPIQLKKRNKLILPLLANNNFK